MSGDKKDDKSPFRGALADQLKKLDVEVRESKEAAEQKEQQKRQQQEREAHDARARRGSSEVPGTADSDQPRPLSDEELFRLAVEQMGPEDIYQGKFEGGGVDLPPAPDRTAGQAAPPAHATAPGAPGSPAGQAPEEQAPEEQTTEEAEQAARAELLEARDMRTFERAIGGVDERMDERKRRYRKPRKPSAEEFLAPYTSESPAELITPSLPKAGPGLHDVGPLDGAQRDVLERFKKRRRDAEVPELNLRGDGVEDALRQLELFVHQQWKNDARFVRVIHGRGLQSDGDPVLKPAVLHWLEGPGLRYIRGYVPETNSANDYGSLIVELARRRTGRSP